MAKDERMIAALLREREGYERRNLDDRVRQVDEQLEHYGHKPEGRGPKGRSTPPQQTADQGAAASKPPAKTAAAKKTAVSTPPPESTTEQPAPPPAE
jgi:hypothetical protein